jgi:hypothetical protein
MDTQPSLLDPMLEKLGMPKGSCMSESEVIAKSNLTKLQHSPSQAGSSIVLRL